MKKRLVMMLLIALVSLSACTGKNSNRQLFEKYPDISSLPAVDMPIENKYVFDDRTMILEDSIDNGPELLTYLYYYNISSGEFDQMTDLIGENESLQIITGNEEAGFNEGNYMSEYILHELTTLTAEDLQKANDHTKEDILEKIDTYGLDQYVIVYADISWKHNELSLSMGPQLGDGRYSRYYLFATTKKVPEWKLYEVYWEDFITPPQ